MFGFEFRRKRKDPPHLSYADIFIYLVNIVNTKSLEIKRTNRYPLTRRDEVA